MTEQEFKRKLAWDGTRPSCGYIDIAERAISVAKEAGAKFEPGLPERINCDGRGVYGVCPNGGNEMLTLADFCEVCRRYNDRAEVATLILEMNGVIFGLIDEPDLKHRLNSWLTKEGAHR